MKYIIALFLSFGMLHFTMAQDDSKAPADVNSQSELDGTARSYENEDRSYMDENQSKLQEESDMNSSDMNSGSAIPEDNASSSTSNSSTSNEYNQYNEYNMSNPEPTPVNTTTTTTEVVKTEKKDGLLENIVEAPFKFVGHTVAGVGEGVWDISKGVGKGVGRIVAAPFKGLGKAFGIGGNKNKTEVASSTVTTVEPATEPVIMDESAKNTDTDVILEDNANSDVIIDEECM